MDMTNPEHDMKYEWVISVKETELDYDTRRKDCGSDRWWTGEIMKEIAKVVEGITEKIEAHQKVIKYVSQVWFSLWTTWWWPKCLKPSKCSPKPSIMQCMPSPIQHSIST